MNLYIITGVIGPWQIVLIVVVVLVLFGGRKIPDFMRGLGEGIREFKKASKGETEEGRSPGATDDTSKKDIKS